MTTTEATKTRVAILGASGYTGGELVRILARHPQVEMVVLTADRHAGESLETVFPHLGGLDLPRLMKIEEVEWAGLDVDVVFCGLPHGTTQEIVKGLLHATGHTVVDEVMHEGREDLVSGVKKDVKVIDLSADFRLEDVDTYAEWYGHEHYAPTLQPEAVYGLTELHRDDIRDARLVACPGCYPTVPQLALVPLLVSGLIDPQGIIIDAKSGATGAGRAAKQAMLYTEVAEGAHAYGLAGHRHTPEMEQELSKAASAAVTISFTPHLLPMNRGLLATMYVTLTGEATADDLRDTLVRRYDDEPFVRITQPGVAPSTRDVRGSNTCLIGVFEDRIPGRAIVIGAIDNLVKGSSGQAVQNMNVMLGYPETLGLEQEPLFP
jgi:N-acetyl-gamma-glutamyl-phosphate reductase